MLGIMITFPSPYFKCFCSFFLYAEKNIYNFSALFLERIPVTSDPLPVLPHQNSLA